VIDYLGQCVFEEMFVGILHFEVVAFVIFAVEVSGEGLVNEPGMAFDLLESYSLDGIRLVIKPLRFV
jgi:hypothetical protein